MTNEQLSLTEEAYAQLTAERITEVKELCKEDKAV